MKLYHISSVKGLKILQPKLSTHAVPYVYATSNLELGLFFGSSKSMGDFDGIYGTNNGKPFFYEAYPNAFKRRFENQTCYIYQVDPTTFLYGKTSFKAEVVSEKPVKVINCTKVENLYNKLMSLVEENKIELKMYDENPKYISMINEHIKDRILRYGIMQRKNSTAYRFCQDKFPHILKELENGKQQDLQ